MLVQVGQIITAQGPQQAEKLLVAQVVAEAAHAQEDPPLLKEPILVVVPSSELRLSLIAKLAVAGATLGVEVQTLHSVALNLHRNAGMDISSGSLLSEVLAQRAVKQQAGLRQTFEPLADGLGLVAATVRDLLTAGLGGYGDGEPGADGENLGPNQAGLNRQSREVIAAAMETKRLMAARGCRRPGDLQVQAARLVEDHLHARSVWIYGFADVTGQSRPLVQALWQRNGKLVVDLPPDPAFGDEDRGARFARNFVQRVCAVAVPDTEANHSPPQAQREFFHTSGRSDEVREVVHRIRKLIAAGAEAESIGVVVRHYEAYASHVRHWFAALGVPLRAPTPPAGFFPDHRRMRAALEVLQLGPDATVDRWLDALSRAEKGGALKSRVEDFRIAMRTLGVARLGQAAALDANELAGEHGVYRLPIRVRSEEGQSDDGGERRRSQSRVLTLTELMSDISLVQQTLQRVADWPRRASLVEHADYARLVLEQEFRWSAAGGDWRDRASTVGAISDWHELLRKIAELDDADDYESSEFLILLNKAARDFGVPKSNSAGGGVAVLDFTQARGRTFDSLFVLGLNRGVVPRAISDDAVLPDSQRAVLQGGAHDWAGTGAGAGAGADADAGAEDSQSAGHSHNPATLPDLPLRSSGHDEERYLFAQLCAAAPHLTLSWLRADDDGKETAPSSFLQRIWLSHREGEREQDAVAVPRLRNQMFADTSQPLSEAESEQYFALHGDRSSWMQLLPSSAARLRVLNELEPDFSDRKQSALRSATGPYFGMTGPRSAPEQLFVTTLEGVAMCPWRAVLERQLRIEPIDDPLRDLPAADALMLGNVTHDALEKLVTDGAGGKLDGKTAIKVGKPTASAVASAVKAAAMKVALSEEMRLQGLIDALAKQALPFVQRAVDLEWPDDEFELEVIGCEWQGQTKVVCGDEEFDLHFRADRVDQGQDGLVFTDYKTSKPLTDRVRPDTQRKHHLAQLAMGKRLQGAAYASSSFDASGRYLFLKVDEDSMHKKAEFRVNHDDEDFMVELSRTSGVLHQAQLNGLNPPRMDRPKPGGGSRNNEACDYCKVADACLLRDSGSRARLSSAVEQIAERRMVDEQSLHAGERLLSDLWYLGVQAPWQEEGDE